MGEKISKSGFNAKISEWYDTMERPRLEKAKEELQSDPFAGYFNKEAVRVSLFEKLGRLAMDKLGIRFKRSEERRRWEARQNAEAELYAEEEAKKKADEEQRKMTEDRLQKLLEEAEERKKKWESEREWSEFMDAADELGRRKQRRIENQRAQELVERHLNSRLLTVDRMEKEVYLETPGIRKNSASYGKDSITVYDLVGYPFAFLSTTIDYRKNSNSGTTGAMTSKVLMANPEIWLESQEKVEKMQDYGTRHGNARSNTISASYWNSECNNIDTFVPGELIYGFEKVDGDSIIRVSNWDGGTPNNIGRMETTVNAENAIYKLEGWPRQHGNYNEVTLRRYLDDGESRKPDYVIVIDGNISDVALKHASFFNIPIVNVEKRFYEGFQSEKTSRK